MKTPTHKENPFGANRYGFLWETLAEQSPGRHLDFGSYDGDTLKKLATTGVISKGVGVDVNRTVLDQVADLPDNVTLVPIDKGSELPFEDDSFDSASILDVIEHIHDQESVLNELNRVLKPDGRMIITVPRRHVFSFLDIGNFKFMFPRLHKHAYCLKHSKEQYQTRYVECANGLFGDVETEKMWHQHFSQQEMTFLLESCGFQPVGWDGSGLFTRPLLLLRLVCPITDAPVKKTIEKDFARFHSMKLFCTARKAA